MDSTRSVCAYCAQAGITHQAAPPNAVTPEAAAPDRRPVWIGAGAVAVVGVLTLVLVMGRGSQQARGPAPRKPDNAAELKAATQKIEETLPALGEVLTDPVFQQNSDPDAPAAGAQARQKPSTPAAQAPGAGSSGSSPAPAGAAQDLAPAKELSGRMGQGEELYAQVVGLVRRSQVGLTAEHPEADRALADFKARLIATKTAFDVELEKGRSNPYLSGPAAQHVQGWLGALQQSAASLELYLGTGSQPLLVSAAESYTKAKAEHAAFDRLLQ